MAPGPVLGPARVKKDGGDVQLPTSTTTSPAASVSKVTLRPGNDEKRRRTEGPAAAKGSAAAPAAPDNEAQRWQRELRRRAGEAVREPQATDGLNGWLRSGKATSSNSKEGTAVAVGQERVRASATPTVGSSGKSGVSPGRGPLAPFKADTAVADTAAPCDDYGVRPDSRASYWPLDEGGNGHVFKGGAAAEASACGARHWEALYLSQHKGWAWGRARRHARACGVHGPATDEHLARARLAQEPSTASSAAAERIASRSRAVGELQRQRVKGRLQRAAAAAAPVPAPAAAGPRPAPARAAAGPRPVPAPAAAGSTAASTAASAADARAPKPRVSKSTEFDTSKGSGGVAAADYASVQFDPNTSCKAYRLHRCKKFDWKSLVIDHGDATVDHNALRRLEAEAAKDDTEFGRALREHLRLRGDEEVRRSSFRLPAFLRLLRADSGQSRGAWIYINASRGLDFVDNLDAVPASEMDNYTSATQDHPELVTADIARLEELEFVMPWDKLCEELGIDDAKPRVVHSLGAVLRHGRVRIVIDASRGEVDGMAVNDIIKGEGKACFASIDDAKRCMSSRGQFARADLRDAFLQSALSKRSVSLCGFKWVDKDGNAKYYGYRTLGFGFSIGPMWQQCLATMLTRAVMMQMDELGFRIGSPLPDYCSPQVACTPAAVGSELTAILSLLDDFAFFGSDMKSTHAAFCRFLYITSELGIVVSPKAGKTDPPCRVMVYLGILLSLNDMTASLDEERVADLTARLEALAGKGELTKKELQSIIGTLVFCACVIRCGRPSYKMMLELLNQYKESGARGRITLDEPAQGDIKMWLLLLKEMNGCSVITGVRMPRLKWDVWTDASYGGFGWWAECGTWDAGRWPASWRLRMGESRYKSIWICECEILAVALALRQLAPFMAGCSSVWHIDNLPVVYMLRKHSARSRRCAAIVKEIEWCCAIWGIELMPVHIRTYDNKLADALSREHEMDDLGPEERGAAQLELDTLMQDFGERVARKCPIPPRRCAMQRPDLLPLLSAATVQFDLWQDELTPQDIEEMERLLPEYLRCEQLQSAMVATGSAMATARERELQAQRGREPRSYMRAAYSAARERGVKRARPKGDRGALDTGR